MFRVPDPKRRSVLTGWIPRKLTADQAREIRAAAYAARDAGTKIDRAQIAESYGLSRSALNDVINGTWQNV
jgi:hypothetical protein